MNSEYRVLILEDVEGDFVSLKKSILNYFKTNKENISIQVLPELLAREINHYGNWRFFKSQFKANNNDRAWEVLFKEILDFYANNNIMLDIFVLDIALESLNGPDIRGIQFANFLNQKNYNFSNFNIIFVSSSSRKNIQSLISGNYEFINIDKTSANYEVLVTREIQKLIKKKADESSDIIPAWKMKLNAKEFGFGPAISILGIYIRHRTTSLIDKFILFVFYILIFSASAYAVVNIVFLPLSKVARKLLSDDKSVDQPQHLLPSEIQNPESQTQILTTAEHIFLYLLPIFILFGFFSYYKDNIRISFLEGNTTKINEGHSTSGIRLSKTLFVSSLIAYVLIKIIEEIFYHPDQKPDYIKLVSAGLLIILLMIYFFFLEKQSHSK